MLLLQGCAHADEDYFYIALNRNATRKQHGGGARLHGETSANREEYFVF